MNINNCEKTITQNEDEYITNSEKSIDQNEDVNINMIVFDKLKHDVEYVHFHDIESCDDFITHIPNLTISHKCCGGIGVGIKSISSNELDNIIKQYLQINKTKKIIDY